MPRRISKLSDDNLNAQLNAVRAMIRRARKAENDSVDAEKELCWLERESEIRDIRRQMHEEYTKRVTQQMQREQQDEYEAMLEHELHQKRTNN